LPEASNFLSRRRAITFCLRNWSDLSIGWNLPFLNDQGKLFPSHSQWITWAAARSVRFGQECQGTGFHAIEDGGMRSSLQAFVGQDGRTPMSSEIGKQTPCAWLSQGFLNCIYKAY
jgi:hypothetical protein